MMTFFYVAFFCTFQTDFSKAKKKKKLQKFYSKFTHPIPKYLAQLHSRCDKSSHTG